MAHVTFSEFHILLTEIPGFFVSTVVLEFPWDSHQFETMVFRSGEGTDWLDVWVSKSVTREEALLDHIRGVTEAWRLMLRKESGYETTE